MIIFAQSLLPGARALVGVDEKTGRAGISGQTCTSAYLFDTLVTGKGEAAAGDLGVALGTGEPCAGDLSGDIGAAFCGVSRNCAILG